MQWVVNLAEANATYCTVWRLANNQSFTSLCNHIPDCADQVYVTGLPKDTTEADIEAHFGSIGLLKVDKKRERDIPNAKKIWLYKDKATGELKVHMAVSISTQVCIFNMSDNLNALSHKHFVRDSLLCPVDEFCIDCTAAVQVAQSGGKYGVSHHVKKAFNLCINRIADYEAKSSKSSRMHKIVHSNLQEIHDVESLLQDVVQCNTI